MFSASEVLFGLLLAMFQVELCGSINWKSIRCASDTSDDMADGTVPLARFPWLGVVQHSFYLAEKIRFAVTSGILIHPGYVLAPAEDIGRIPVDQISNNTKFIVWPKEDIKYALDIYDYSLHPDYMDKTTMATVAVLQLRDWAGGRRMPPVDPVCLPLKGVGDFDNLHVVKFSDANNKIEKELYKMNYIMDKDCSEFYYKAQLSYEKMSPRYSLCAVVEANTESCIWDSGAMLISKTNFAYWTLLGFGVRGPGCGAPAKFVSLHRLLEWIDEVITARPLEDLPPGHSALFLRQLSPWKVQLFKAETQIPTDYGQCEKNTRGTVIYKDNAEILTNKNFASGFFFVSVYSIAMFSCAIVHFDAMSRSTASLWVEHHCHQQVTGSAVGMEGPDARKYECFLYFKTVAFIEFRFIFSFRAEVSTTLYGVPLRLGKDVNPWISSETTDSWWPTNRYIKYGSFVPYYLWYWDL